MTMKSKAKLGLPCGGCVHAVHKGYCGRSYIGAGGRLYNCACTGVPCTDRKRLLGRHHDPRPMLGLELTGSLEQQIVNTVSGLLRVLRGPRISEVKDRAERRGQKLLAMFGRKAVK